MADWKIDELTHRKEAALKDPSATQPWEQVKAKIHGQHAGFDSLNRCQE